MNYLTNHEVSRKDHNNMKKALVIIDVQNEMFTYDGGVLNGDLVLGVIKSLIKEARRKEVPIIYIQHTETEGEFMEGQETWQIHKQIKPSKADIVIQKNYWDAFMHTTLEATLRELSVTDLIICGMQTEFCVDTTLRRSFSLGFKNTLVKDGHSTFNTEELTANQIIHHHNQIFNGRFAELVLSENIQF